MAWALIIPLGSLLGGKGGAGGGRIPYKILVEKLEWNRPLKETYPNTQISFSREYNGAISWHTRNMNVKHRNCGSNHNNLISLFVKVKKKMKQKQ